MDGTEVILEEESGQNRKKDQDNKKEDKCSNRIKIRIGKGKGRVQIGQSKEKGKRKDQIGESKKRRK